MPTSRTRSYSVGLASGYVATVANGIATLWLLSFSLRFLDREQLAVFTLGLDVVAWLSLADLGLTDGVNVQVARLGGQNERQRNALASTAFYTQTLVACIVLLLGCILASLFPHFFALRPDLHRAATLLMVLLSGGFALILIGRTFAALLIAHHYIYYNHLITVVMVLIRLLLAVTLFLTGWSLLALPITELGVAAATMMAVIYAGYKLIPNLTVRPQLFSKQLLSGTATLGLWFTLGTLADFVIMGFDRVVAAKLISLESVTVLYLTSRVYSLADGVLQQITKTARPMLGSLLGQGMTAEALQAYQRLSALSTSIYIVAAATFWAGNESFVSSWVGKDNYGGIPLDIALALSLVVRAWILPNRVILGAGLIVRPQTVSRLVEGALNLGLSIWFAQLFGLSGIVLATALGGCLTSCWYLPTRTARMFGRPVRPDVWGNFRRMSLLFVCMAVVAVAAKAIALRVGGFAGAFVGSSLTGTVGLALLWRFILDSGAREKVVRTLAELRRFGLSAGLR